MPNGIVSDAAHCDISTRVRWSLVAVERAPYGRTDAVRADENIASGRLARCERHRDAGIVRSECCGFGIQLDATSSDGVEERAVQRRTQGDHRARARRWSWR